MFIVTDDIEFCTAVYENSHRYGNVPVPPRKCVKLPEDGLSRKSHTEFLLLLNSEEEAIKMALDYRKEKLNGTKS